MSWPWPSRDEATFLGLEKNQEKSKIETLFLRGMGMSEGIETPKVCGKMKSRRHLKRYQRSGILSHGEGSLDWRRRTMRSCSTCPRRKRRSKWDEDESLIIRKGRTSSCSRPLLRLIYMD
ncbi:hypothetical protein HPP92_008374 [Vanilla planifolia]|uniref:Uncharacterized protein n=1 Tax=Vanilla planifolia TaxID=51239 RepID=A0A835V3P8_VANPL|nr:hypothetical protein HPP92_008374 [Vanilla planifolia]